jgi:hypothetical protein
LPITLIELRGTGNDAHSKIIADLINELLKTELFSDNIRTTVISGSLKKVNGSADIYNPILYIYAADPVRDMEIAERIAKKLEEHAKEIKESEIVKISIQVIQIGETLEYVF